MRAFHVMKGLVFFYNVKMLIFSIKWGGGDEPSSSYHKEYAKYGIHD